MMSHRILNQRKFHDAARTGRAGGSAVLRTGDGDPEPIANSRKIRFCFSDGSVDRMGDTISPYGWDVTEFSRNPVCLWNHDSSAPPIGRASAVQVEGGRLMGTIEFATAETYPHADTVYRLVKGGFLNAVSVGFMPISYEFVEDNDRPWGIDFKEQELLEISVCPVPANAGALAEGRSLTGRRSPRLERQASRADPVELLTTGEREAIAIDLRMRHLPDRPNTAVGRRQRIADIRRALGPRPKISPARVMADFEFRRMRFW